MTTRRDLGMCVRAYIRQPCMTLLSYHWNVFIKVLFMYPVLDYTARYEYQLLHLFMLRILYGIYLVHNAWEKDVKSMRADEGKSLLPALDAFWHSVRVSKCLPARGRSYRLRKLCNESCTIHADKSIFDSGPIKWNFTVIAIFWTKRGTIKWPCPS